MLEMFVFAFGVMYTPGPVNLIALGNGLNGNYIQTLRFSLGVGLAMWLLITIAGYLGALLIQSSWLGWIGLIGGLYILYLARHLAKSATHSSNEGGAITSCSLRSGFMVQLFNPKAPIAVLPLISIYFPTLGITGTRLSIYCAIMALMAFSAPTTYLAAGFILGRHLHSSCWLKRLNLGMSVILFFLAVDILTNSVIRLFG